MACTGCNDGCLDSIELAEGPQGLFGGFSGEWLFSTGTTSAQSAGKLGFNNANIASATAIYVNKTNIDNKDLSLFLASFSNSSNYGLLRVFKEDDNSKFWYGTLTAIAGPTSNVYTLTVTTILTSFSSGTFTANDNVVMSFSPKGDTGSSGSNSIILYNHSSNEGTTNASGPQTLGTAYSLLAGTLSVTGDIIEVDALVSIKPTSSTQVSFRVGLTFDGTNIGRMTFITTGLSRTVHIKAEISRTGASAQRILTTIILNDPDCFGSFTTSSSGPLIIIQANDTAINLASGTRILAVTVDKGNSSATTFGDTFATDEIIKRKLTVKHIKQ